LLKEALPGSVVAVKDSASSIANVMGVEILSLRLVGIVSREVMEKCFAVLGVETMPKPHVTILLGGGARDVNWPAQVYEALIVVSYFVITAHTIL
jgi:hypothetical protein